MMYAALVWIALGLVVGFIATKFVDLRGDSPILGIGAAVGGAVALGLVFAMINGVPSPSSIIAGVFAVVGAAAGAAIFHYVRSRSISRDRQTVRSSY